jgi:hypothetical protein
LEATVLPDELSAKPSRPVLIASPPFVAALLIGSKGVLNPKVQVQARRGVTLRSQLKANVQQNMAFPLSLKFHPQELEITRTAGCRAT